MKINVRRYQSENDYWRIREFLDEVLLLNTYHELSWQTYRFDYWRWHGVENMGHGRLETDVFIWETPDGRIAAVLNREAPGSIFLQVHPDRRTSELEIEMIDVAEKNLTISTPDNRRKLGIWVHEHDRQRQNTLASRGYRKSTVRECQRYRPLSKPIPDESVFEGYTIRGMGNDEDMPARSLVSWKAFHPDEPMEKYRGWEWYRNIQRAPLYRRDLDIVAVASGGQFASFCTVWFNGATLTGAFEPVGTAPAHRRRGLAAAVMNEGLRRLKRLGAKLAYVGSWDDATDALYGELLGFSEYDLMERWVKAW